MKQKTVTSVTLDFDIIYYIEKKSYEQDGAPCLALHIQVGSGLMPCKDVTIIHSKAPNTKKIQALVSSLLCFCVFNCNVDALEETNLCWWGKATWKISITIIILRQKQTLILILIGSSCMSLMQLQGAEPWPYLILQYNQSRICGFHQQPLFPFFSES